ncbi:fasciclin-2-like [Limulus polyphemus]|uniref:Fasciclin-2-like n=1 Tax=Limulus polyphemus TaxID=6850 RepID=A0ABM1BLU3_LIMPO|nr:fasciclin-2-like [Limulus polyphemus]
MSKVHEKDGGKYRIQAMVTETGRFKHRDINLEVLIPPNITEFQEKAQAIEENDLVLKCVASIANPTPLYSWFDKNDHQLQTQERFSVDKTLGTLTIQNVKKEDAGDYSCVAQNEAGQDKKQLQLTVLSKPKILQFEKKNTVEGKSASLECRASGVPHPEVSLRKEGSHKQLESGGRVIIENFQEKEIVSLKMTISQVMREDDGQYFCRAENIAGNMEKAGHLTVEFKPRVSTPKSKFMKTWSENSVNLTCIADAIPNATVQWSFNGQEIKSDQSETYTIYGKGGYSNLLVKPSSKTNVYGSYDCEGVNIHGKDNIIIQLTEASVPRKLLEVNYKDITSTTITFEFVGPEDDGGMPISSYLVEYREESDLPENVKVKEMTAGTTNILENLKPRATYIFRFAAKNAVGTGMWLDKESWTMPKESAPDPPIIVSPSGNISAFPDKIEIRWTINQDNGKPIKLFQLRYFKIKKDGEDNWKQNGQVKLENLVDNWQSAQYIITGLEPNTYYKVQLRAKNEIGYSQDETRIFQTAQGTMDSHHKEPLTQGGGGVSTSVIVIVVVVLILLILIIIDVTCYFRYKWGLLHFLRNNACGKASDGNRNEKIALDEEKGSFPVNVDEVKSTDEATNSASPVDDEKNLLHKSDEKTKDDEVAQEDTPMILQNSENDTVIEEDDKNEYSKESKTSLQ